MAASTSTTRPLAPHDLKISSAVSQSCSSLNRLPRSSLGVSLLSLYHLSNSGFFFCVSTNLPSSTDSNSLSELDVRILPK